MLYQRDSVHEAYFNIKNGEEEGLAINKKEVVFQLRKDADRKRLFLLKCVNIFVHDIGRREALWE